MRGAAILGSVLLLASACSTGAPSPSAAPATVGPPLELWGLPDDPMGLAREAGLEPLDSERLEFHVHAHVSVFQEGQPVIVPGGIGIDITDPAVKAFPGPGYGGIQTPCDDPCISPLHTHDPDGIIHTESATTDLYTFDQFLIEWDVTLPEGTKAYVDGREWTDPIGDIELSDGREIAIIIGTPPAEIPSTFPPGAR